MRMDRACVVAFALSLGGCTWSYSIPVEPEPIPLAEEAHTWGPMPVDPSPPLRVWVGAPPALFGALPTAIFPEHPPQSLPWRSAIWVPEHYDWDWDGINGWQWLRGRWIDRPGPGWEWNPPTYVYDEHGSYFVPGFFCPPYQPVPPPAQQECAACEPRGPLHRSRVACMAGLPRATKLALAREAAQPAAAPGPVLVSR
jgi:hypothetical protein